KASPTLGSWGVTYPTSLQGIRGSCVVIPCTLSYPDDMAADDGIVAIWYKDYDNQKTLVYHSAAQEVDAGFRDRAQLLGDPAARNCTLLLRRLTLEDHGPYRFRFEIINGDRWSAERDVMLSVLGGYSGETPPLCQLPEQTEGQTSTLQCSTPYFCPLSDTALRWEGYDPQVSVVSGWVQLDTNGVSHHLTLTTSFSWKDHSKKLLCEVSYGSKKATSEVHRHLLSCSILSPLTDPPRTPTITLFQETQGGRLAIVSCTVDSHPPATIALYRDGTLLAASGSQAAPRQRLGVTTSPDEGSYRCTATNAHGTVAQRLYFHVQSECRVRHHVPSVASSGGSTEVSTWGFLLPGSHPDSGCYFRGASSPPHTHTPSHLYSNTSALGTSSNGVGGGVSANGDGEQHIFFTALLRTRTPKRAALRCALRKRGGFCFVPHCVTAAQGPAVPNCCGAL
uniref:Sialic acid binding Ig like lectin 1 n=1 Tax=Falco tinnunculus TaxID=100819 RepID=A0A8C4V6M3_FALTI